MKSSLMDIEIERRLMLFLFFRTATVYNETQRINFHKASWEKIAIGNISDWKLDDTKVDHVRFFSQSCVLCSWIFCIFEVRSRTPAGRPDPDIHLERLFLLESWVQPEKTIKKWVSEEEWRRVEKKVAELWYAERVSTYRIGREHLCWCG